MGKSGFSGGLGTSAVRKRYKKARQQGMQNRFTRTWDDLISNASGRSGAPTIAGDSPFSGVPNRSTSAAGTGGTATDAILGAGSGGSSGGSSGGTGGGSGTAPYQGFASQYAPGSDVFQMLTRNPEVFVRDTLKAMGYNADSGYMDMLGNGTAKDLQNLAVLTQGTKPGSVNASGDDDYINFANDWIKNQITPGGYGIDSQAMLQSILDAPDGSALAAALAGGTTEEQAYTLNDLVKTATASMTPLMQRILASTMQDRTNDWLSEQAKGSHNTSLADYLQQGGGGILGR